MCKEGLPVVEHVAASRAAVARGTCWQGDPWEMLARVGPALVAQQMLCCSSAETRTSAPHGSRLDRVLPVVSPHVCCNPPCRRLGSGFSKASCPTTQEASVLSLQQVPLSRPFVFPYLLSVQNQSQSHVWSFLLALSTIKFSMPFAKWFPPFQSHSPHLSACLMVPRVFGPPFP